MCKLHVFTRPSGNIFFLSANKFHKANIFFGLWSLTLHCGHYAYLWIIYTILKAHSFISREMMAKKVSQSPLSLKLDAEGLLLSKRTLWSWVKRLFPFVRHNPTRHESKQLHLLVKIHGKIVACAKELRTEPTTTFGYDDWSHRTPIIFLFSRSHRDRAGR